MQVIEVAAGLIHRDGCISSPAVKRPGAHLAGFWEFPGGKRETGESLTECLQRELFEELSIRVDLPIPYRIIRP
ncbi:MAG: NUDIX domain-containing protein [Nitrospira sp.]